MPRVPGIRLKGGNIPFRRHLGEDVKRARAHCSQLADHQPARRRGEAVPVSVEDGILEEGNGGFCCFKTSAGFVQNAWETRRNGAYRSSSW